MAISSTIIALSSYAVPVAQATAYTVPGATVRFRIDQASVTNYTATARTLTVYILQSGEAVADSRKAIDALSIPANSTVALFELVGRGLNTGGIINAFASVVSTLALSITGTNNT